jgi:hypothetical protein
VQDAKDALKPRAVWDSIEAHGLVRGRRDGRRNEAFVRQGEWFFVPRPELRVDASKVLEHEPIRRGAGKPHWCQYLYREGGQVVYVSAAFPNGLTKVERRQLSSDERQRYRWTRMVREPHAYVKGSVAHVDHKTIWLPHWHEVVMNRETEAAAMRHVAFLD